MLDSIIGFMIKYEIIVKFIAPLVTALIAILNIIFVVLVFKLNSKLSQSKLSVVPFSSDLSSYNNISSSQKEDSFLIDLATISSLKKADNISKGPKAPDHRSVTGLVIKNDGSLASSNIVVVFTLKLYGTKFNYKTGLSWFNDLRRPSKRTRVFSKRKKVRISYMGAQEEKTIGLYLNRGEFREVEIVLNKIKGNRFVYFKNKFIDKFLNPTVMSHYIHPDLNKQSSISDKEFMILMGAKPEKFVKPNENTIE